MKNIWNVTLRRLLVYAGLCLGAALGALVVLMLLSNLILNGYGKGKIERMFAAAHPGSTLRIGGLVYVIGANRLTATAVTLSSAGSTLKAGRISLVGVRWTRLLKGTAALSDVLARASLDAANLSVGFPGARYGISCARLRAAVPDSMLIATGAELAPPAGDEEFFASDRFRMTRYRVAVPECRVLGLDYGEMLRGTSYRARSIYISRISFNSLTNRDKQPRPFKKSPRMVNEALAAIRPPLQVDSLRITDGLLEFCIRKTAGAAPGVLPFTGVELLARGITNRGGPDAAIRLAAQGKLMDAGELTVLMTIPLATPGFTLHYTGSLGPMDLTRLNPFLDIVQHLHIKSGRAAAATFAIDVADGQARGSVHAVYHDLVITMLDKITGSEKGFGNRVATFVANHFTIDHNNAPEEAGPMNVGTVYYRRKPSDTFLKVAWYGLKSGVLDVIKR